MPLKTVTTQRATQMSRIRDLAIALLLSLAAIAHAHAADAAQAPCAPTPEAGAIGFLRASIQNTPDGIPFLTPRSLASFRTRLAQLLDDRYAPDSAELRRRLQLERLASDGAARMSDAEFVSAYFAAGSARAARATLLDATVTERRTERYLGEAVKVRYRISTEGRETTQERVYYLNEDKGCWRLDMPLEAKARLAQLSRFLKESRVDPQFAAGNSPRLDLRVAPAAESAFPFATQFNGPNGMRSPVWIANAALLTGSDLEGVSANWDCDLSGQPTEDAALGLRFDNVSAQRLEGWSGQNVGSMLAIVLQGEVVAYAKVSSKLSNRLSICLPGRTLEQARDIARQLAGQPAH